MINQHETVKIEGICSNCCKSSITFMRMIEFEINNNSGGICEKCFDGNIEVTNFEIG